MNKKIVLIALLCFSMLIPQIAAAQIRTRYDHRDNRAVEEERERQQQQKAENLGNVLIGVAALIEAINNKNNPPKPNKPIISGGGGSITVPNPNYTPPRPQPRPQPQQSLWEKYCQQNGTGLFGQSGKNAYNINGDKVRLIIFAAKGVNRYDIGEQKRLFQEAAREADRANINWSFGGDGAYIDRKYMNPLDRRVVIVGYYNYTKGSYGAQCIYDMQGTGFGYAQLTGSNEGKAWKVHSDNWDRTLYTINSYNDFDRGGRLVRNSVTIQLGHHKGNTGKLRVIFPFARK